MRRTTGSHATLGGSASKSRTYFVPRGYIDGFIMSNGTDTAHDIDISAGYAVGVHKDDSADFIPMQTSSVITKQIDANWAEGSAAGGFPSGLTLSDTTWYHYFLIAKRNGVVDAGFDTSLTAANLLADATDYLFYRRIGAILTFDSGGSNFDITLFSQYGDQFLWEVVPAVHTATCGVTNVNVALETPDAVQTFAIINVSASGSANSQIYVYSNDVNSADADADNTTSPLASVTSLSSGSPSAGGSFQVRTDTSSQVRVTGDNANAVYYISVLGWIDPRGRSW